MIKVLNKHTATTEELKGSISVMRPSVLGNLYKVKPYGPYSREEAVEAYEVWLRQELVNKNERVRNVMNALYLAAKQGHEVKLVCCCHPKRCHAHVIKRLLEEALEAISMCKQCNARDQLDGEMFPGEMTLEDYAEMYAQLMSMYGEGEGDGEGNPGGRGIGSGGIVEEDDSGESSFVDEKSKSAIQKGKILLSLKTKGLSDTGDIKDEEYKRVVGELRQSLEEVIDQEEIPPGYIESIKKYFDTLDREND
jgi:hypothetical protein